MLAPALWETNTHFHLLPSAGRVNSAAARTHQHGGGRGFPPAELGSDFRTAMEEARVWPAGRQGQSPRGRVPGGAVGWTRGAPTPQRRKKGAMRSVAPGPHQHPWDTELPWDTLCSRFGARD